MGDVVSTLSHVGPRTSVRIHLGKESGRHMEHCTKRACASCAQNMLGLDALIAVGLNVCYRHGG